jgi:methionine sulfoxide reductase heme-binding subunit
VAKRVDTLAAEQSPLPRRFVRGLPYGPCNCPCLFAQLDPKLFHEEVGWFQYVFGGLAYGFIAAMTATSFDRTAAWIGPKAWRALHTIGAYYIAISFLYLEFSAAIYYPYYRPFAVFAALILIIRFIRPPTRRQASVIN